VDEHIRGPDQPQQSLRRFRLLEVEYDTELTAIETATLSNGPSSKRVWITAIGVHVDYYVGLPDLRHRLRGHRRNAVPRSRRAVPSQILRTTLLLPKSIPTKALILEDPEPSLLGSGVGVPGGIAGGREGGVPGGLLNSLMNEASRVVPVVRPPEVIRLQPPKTQSAPAAPLPSRS